MTGPGNGIADANRERVIETLKVAFVQERLTWEELDARIGGALGARSGTELAVLTADLPDGLAATPPPVRGVRLSKEVRDGLRVIGSLYLIAAILWLSAVLAARNTVGAALAFTAVMTFGSPLGNAASMLVSDRFGRKPSLVLCTLAAAVVGVLYSMAATPTEVVIAGFLLVFFMGLMIGLGWALYVPELFPTELRMRGAGLCNTAGRIVSIFMPYAVVALFENWGVAGVVLTLSAILLATAAAILLLGIETRCRSLEDLRPEEDQLLLSGAVAKGPQA